MELLTLLVRSSFDHFLIKLESGETMKAAGLKAIDTVMETQAVLISSTTSGTRSPNLSYGSSVDLQTLITNRIRGVIAAKKYVLLNYNVPRSMLSEVVKITPGKRAPTVSPLEGARLGCSQYYG